MKYPAQCRIRNDTGRAFHDNLSFPFSVIPPFDGDSLRR